MSSAVSVVAIIAAYNEADIIEQVVRDLIDQQIRVYLLDDGSTDGTAAVIEPYAGRGVIGIERLHEKVPGNGTFSLERILRRKTELAASLDADWFINHDADEFRESPWADLSLAEAIGMVDRLGFNAIDFAGFDFWPTAQEQFRPGTDVRAAFQWCTAAAPYDRVQIRAWKKVAGVDLASGGHDAQFEDRRVFPVRFILRHYPIRGETHGMRKVFQERLARYPESERARGWHVQYDGFREGASFLRDPSTLIRFDPTAVRIDLAVRPRGIEALEAEVASRDQRLEAVGRSLDASRREAADLRTTLLEETGRLQAARQELDASRRHAAGLQERVAAMGDQLQRQSVTINNLQGTVEERSRRLDAIHASRSWRWMSPARALFRMLGGK